MVTRHKKPALFSGSDEPGEQKPNPIEKRINSIEHEDRRNQHAPMVTNGLKIKLDHLRTFEPLTDNQAAFFSAYKRGDYMTGLLGSAGVGKTFIAMYKALEEVLDKSNSFKRVVVVRSCVMTRDVGFLPGTIDDKQEIYEQPYKEICTTLFEKTDSWDRLKEQGFARFISTTAIRGISIDDAIIIVDECQNMSWQELNTIITRLGYRSKIIFCGDWKQNDLVKSKYDVSGLEEFLNVARKMNEWSEFMFTRDDIVRSSLVKNWVIACEESGL